MAIADMEKEVLDFVSELKNEANEVEEEYELKDRDKVLEAQIKALREHIQK